MGVCVCVRESVHVRVCVRWGGHTVCTGNVSITLKSLTLRQHLSGLITPETRKNMNMPCAQTQGQGTLDSSNDLKDSSCNFNIHQGTKCQQLERKFRWKGQSSC